MQRIRPQARSRFQASKLATCWVKAKVLVAATRATRRAKALVAKVPVARAKTRRAKVLVAKVPVARAKTRRAKALAAKAMRRKAKALVVRRKAKANAAKVAAAAPLKFLHT